MFLDTYYKQFIAKAAIEFMKEIVRSDYEHGVINYLGLKLAYFTKIFAVRA